jgi:type IV pilus assembly protein PilA
MFSRLRDPKGFTLIELMIVVAIIGILAAIAIPNFVNFKNKAIQGTAKANMETVRSALSQYAADKDDNLYPTAGMIGNFIAMCDILDDYGLTFDKNDGETVLKWKAGTVSYAGTGQTYTVQVMANDSSSTTFNATLSGIQ